MSKPQSQSQRPGAPTNATASGPPKSLSSKVTSMRFMQRANETQVRTKLESERTAAVATQQWQVTPSPSPAPVSISNGATPSPIAGASSVAGAASPYPPSPFPGVAHFMPRASVFVDEPIESATPTLPYSAVVGIATSTVPSQAEPIGVAAPASFVAGRRSFGAFNTTVDALVADAKAASAAAARGEKIAAKEKKLSVTDDAMADHYAATTSHLRSISGGGKSASQKKHPQKHQRQAEGESQATRPNKKHRTQSKKK